MKRLYLRLFFLAFYICTKAQYPFELLDSVKYTKYSNWIEYDWQKTKGALHRTLTIKDFYNNHDSLTIQLSTYEKDDNYNYIRIFRNKKEIQKFTEPRELAISDISPVFILDFNKDGLKDIKLTVSLGSVGLGELRRRVIYFFQTEIGNFKKMSFNDFVPNLNRVERDFDKDGNFEIITMALTNYKEHNYWTFDIFKYINGNLINVDDKYGYPLMFQLLNKPNYKVTDKISRDHMNEFGLKMPDGLDIK